MNRLALLAAFLAPATAQAGYFMKGTDVLKACTSEDAMDHAQCVGYLMGVADSFSALQYVMGTSLVCLPEDVTVGQLRHEFVKYAETHPDELEDKGRRSVEAAVVGAFPCPPDPSPEADGPGGDLAGKNGAP